jgi:hypothetical protein
LLAEQPFDDVDDVDTQTKVTVASRIPADLAAEVARLAETGNRTISREIWAAVAEHVGRQVPPPDPLDDPRGPLSSQHGPAGLPLSREGE